MTSWISPVWIVQTLVASMLLTIIVLMLRRPVARSFGPRIAYALWLLPALRMTLPPLPGWRTLYVPVVYIAPGHSTVGLVDPATALGMVHNHVGHHALVHLEALESFEAPAQASIPMLHHVAAPIVQVAPLDWPATVLLIWIAGAALLFGWQMLRYRLFLRNALNGALPLSRECGIDILVSPHVTGPMAAGILRRRILLPTDFLTRYSSDERRLALKHEAAHHDRFDIVANLAGLALMSLHWWNPFARKAYCAFRADQELACDATVLADTAPADRLTYGSAMLKSASAGMPAMACALGHKDQLKQRIRMMAKGPIGAKRLLFGGTLAVAAIGGGLLMTASGQANPAERTEIAPVPPVPPVPPIPATAPVAPEAPLAPAAPSAPDAPLASAAPHAPPPAVAQVWEDGHRVSVNDPNVSAELHRANDEVRQAGEQARRAGEQARLAAASMPDIDALVRTSLDSARAGLAAQCAQQGVTMPANADFSALATCGTHLRDTIRASLRGARASIAHDRSLDAQSRAAALAGIDQAMAESDREFETAGHS